MTRTLTHGAAMAILVGVTAATDAAAQCADRLAPAVINSVRTPEIRNAALTFRLDAAMIAQNGGLPRMIQLAKAQLESTRGTIETERQNQVSLAQQGIGGDKRAADGRLVIQMGEESNRLTAASIDLMECHLRASGGGVGGAAAAMGTGGPSLWNASPAQRQAAMAESMSPQRNSGADLQQALRSVTQKMHEQAMAKASPELAAFYAKQEATRAAGDANMAAHDFGRAKGIESGRKSSVEAQVKMVTGVVQGWQPPRGYAAAGGSGAAIAIADPFAAPAPAAIGNGDSAIVAAIGGSSLRWDAERKVAHAAADGGATCGGRLRAGDYPVLGDGNLLDTPERVSKYLATCSDAAQPLTVLLLTGQMEVRR